MNILHWLAPFALLVMGGWLVAGSRPSVKVTKP